MLVSNNWMTSFRSAASSSDRWSVAILPHEDAIDDASSCARDQLVVAQLLLDCTCAKAAGLVMVSMWWSARPSLLIHVVASRGEVRLRANTGL